MSLQVSALPACSSKSSSDGIISQTYSKLFKMVPSVTPGEYEGMYIVEGGILDKEIDKLYVKY